MYERRTDLIHLYLPLLTSTNDDTRQHARALLLSSYGLRSLSMLRRLLSDPDRDVRQQAREALDMIGSEANISVQTEPFAGMYVECLGSMHVYVGDQSLPAHLWAKTDKGRAGAQKTQHVFAYLVHCGRRGAARAALHDAVWGSTYQAGSLARALTSLRHTLVTIGGDDFAQQALVLTDQHCLLAPTTYETDVQRFERVFEQACDIEATHGLARAAFVYSQAVHLYNGPYMADLARGSGWYQQRRDALASSFVIALDRLAEHAYTCGQYHQCLMFGQQALDVDPSDEGATVWVLRAYFALQERGSAEHSYRRYLELTGLDPRSTEGQHDSVVRAYHTSRQQREVGVFEQLHE